MGSYVERKKAEARLLLNVVGEALKGKDKPPMSLGALKMLGFGIRGA